MGMKTRGESGIALISTLLILVLLSALFVGFILSVNSEQKLIGVDRDQNRAFYGSLAGLERLTADLGTLFNNNYAPRVSQINALATNPPSLTGISFVSPGGGSGYQIEFPLDAQGKPRADTRTIPSGPYEGLVGLITPYTMTSTAHTLTSAEVRMRRTLQTVAVPVFQFGIFSETDLSFHAGPDFNFGGRVHTNGNLYLAEGTGCTLTMSNRVTAVGEVIRTNLINGWPASTNYTGQVKVTTTPGAYRALTASEGSLVGTIGSAQNEPTWTNLSIGTYNGNIRNGRTGARRMDLPLVGMGATPVDLIRRPASNENVANPDVFAQRYFALASLRIMLSDNPADLTSLPTATASAPIQLVGTAPDGTSIATSSGNSGQGYRSPVGTTLIGGFIKMEMQDQAGNWQDVTQEILQLGIAGRDLTGNCANPPNAIVRVQRLRDSPSSCSPVTNPQYQYWPNVLYDTREGALRDNISTSQTTVYLGGVMHYIELDVNNLSRWFRGLIGTNGSNAMNVTGYVVYFSDRRTNRNGANQETGEYGFEDFVNPANVNGTPNGILDTAEDVNGSGALDTYGQSPVLPVASPLDSSARPWTPAVSASIARINSPIFFRRALKLVNGQSIDLGSVGGTPLGLTVASENPVYVQGNYNAPGTFSGDHAACAVIADSVTLLSNSWNDANSFTSPHSVASGSARTGSTTWYRMALIAGKGRPFPQPTSTPQDFGTDGGVHNFIRLLENWSGQTLNYRGSIVSLFYNRQAVGLYKCCNNVYFPPTRGYNFDVEFLEPSLLPPRTPMFRDVIITGFTRLIMPNQ
jgi:hypothetical protein